MELKYKHLYKTVLKEYQNLSKCARVKVAALIVKDGRILSCGYNGTPSGQTNCNELFKTEAGKFYARKSTTEEWLEYSEEEWKELGANIIIYANQLTRTGFPAMQNAAKTILENHRAKECDDMCMSIKEIITLIPEE